MGQGAYRVFVPRSTGKERDSESGNDYFGARYYASTMGRFLSPDPAGCPIHSPASWRMGGKPRSHPARRVPLVPLIFPNQDAVNQQPSSPPLTPVTAITAIPFASTIPSSLRPWCVRSSFAKKSPHPRPGKITRKIIVEKVGFAVSVSHSYVFIINTLHTKSLYGIFAFWGTHRRRSQRCFLDFRPWAC
jgi:hypothetical protein